jgi:subtilisin family serine protease
MRGSAVLAVMLLLPAPALAQAPPTLPGLTGGGVAAETPFAALQNLYAEGFEQGDGGFTAGGFAGWAWGEPEAPPVPAPGQGPKVWGTNLAGDYDDDACGFVESPAIDLTSLPASPALEVEAAGSARALVARLQFRHWLDTDPSYDGGVVMASADGGPWLVLQPFQGGDGILAPEVRDCLGIGRGDAAFTGPALGPPAADAWAFAALDATAMLHHSVRLRWVFGSDAVLTARGWYIDDVRIDVGLGVAAATSPAAAWASVALRFTPLVTLYAADFEVDDGGWASAGTGGAWAWGVAAPSPFPPPGSLRMWGMGLGGDYASDSCSTLTSPPIPLPGADPGLRVEAARLSLRLWRHLESGYDGALLEVAADGGPFVPLVPVDGYEGAVFSWSGARACLGDAGDHAWTGPAAQPLPDAWRDVQADLTRFLGHEVRFRVVFASDEVIEERGVFIDDVLVELGAAARPVIGPGDQVPCAPLPGWSIEGERPTWCYGPPVFGPQKLVPAWDTNLFGSYNAMECSAIVSPPVPVAGVQGGGPLALTFQHYVSTAVLDDGGIVQASADGGPWQTVAPDEGYPAALGPSARACVAPGVAEAQGYAGNPTGNAYLAQRVALGAFEGATLLRVRFLFGAGANGDADGWHVRGVQLDRGGAPLPLMPTLPGGPVEAPEAFAAKATPPLRAAVAPAQPDDPFDVIVTGLPHTVMDSAEDRAAASRALGEQAAPFIEAVRTKVLAEGGRVARAWPLVPAVAVTTDRAGLEALAALPGVRGLELDHKGAVRLPREAAADDAPGAANAEGRAMVEAEEAWALGFRGDGVRLAVIDTGIAASHEAFRTADGASRVAAWRDLVKGRPTPYDDHGHGTHVAGTAAGSSDYVDPQFGAFQETGVAPAATLLVAKFLDSSGSGTFEGALDALQWAFDEGADVTSNSWGSLCDASLATLQMVRQLTDLGMLNVFAAGNAGPGDGTIGGPACAEAALSVGAVDAAGAVAWFSSRGPCSDPELGTAPRPCPDVVAKGVGVRSSVPRAGAPLSDASGYLALSGTSMATPHVAGAAVLAEQMKRAFTGQGWDTAGRAEEAVLKQTALDLGAPGEDDATGAGLAQVLGVYAELAPTDEARVIATFGVAPAVARLGDAPWLWFGVRNAGNATASGAFVAHLTDPLGGLHALRAVNISLSRLEGERLALAWPIDGTAPMGTWTFRGTFTFGWQNATSGDTVLGSVAREGAFEVRRVAVAMAVSGFAASAPLGALEHVVVGASHEGNEAAAGLTVAITVPDAYALLPGRNFDPLDAASRYSDPAPDRVVEDAARGRTTLLYDMGALAVGGRFEVALRPFAAKLGDHHLLAVATFEDGAGRPLVGGVVAQQHIVAELPL